MFQNISAKTVNISGLNHTPESHMTHNSTKYFPTDFSRPFMFTRILILAVQVLILGAVIKTIIPGPCCSKHHQLNKLVIRSPG